MQGHETRISARRTGEARRRDVGNGWTAGGAPPVERRPYLLPGPGGEPEIPSKHPPHPSVLIRVQFSSVQQGESASPVAVLVY
eukprot:scaffold41731_cov75-Phaeocystis_antarctica.AAC.1